MTAPEHWEIPPALPPKPAKLKRIGPKPQFAPSRKSERIYKPSIVATWGEMHVKAGTDINKVRPSMRRTRRSPSWTPEQEQEIKEMYESGMVASEIAERTGRSVGSVRRKLLRIGARRDRFWTRERQQMVVLLLKGGMTTSQIAEEFGMNRHAIQNAIVRHNLRRFL